VTGEALPTRIVVTGSESTGKTELARELAATLSVPWVKEYARLYAEQQGRPLTSADVEPIALGQIEQEETAAGSKPAVLILDSDLVSTVVYARHYYGSCPDWIVSSARKRLGALYLLSDVDVPWVADGVRDRPHSRREIHELFVETLRDLRAEVLLVSGSRADRLARALGAVEAILRAG
jgi:NadR type nicotinamide-nucleotide adenylyltransferase